jgi:asparagine synthase (glutamine-hydrolysing)
MSAIFGLVRFDGARVTPHEIERMGATLAHRGPDRRRTAVSEGVGMGHCLLRVNREDLMEAQPIHDRAAPLMLAADLRLDNREALAASIGIAPATLDDMPDSALLLRAYRHWGTAVVEHLLGDFSFAIWDGATRSVMLARDPMGQRGLFYHVGGHFLAFASEAKALWAIEGVPRRLSEAAIGRRLLFPVDPAPGESLYDRISVLPGGTLLRIAGDGVAMLHRYWEPQAAAEHVGRDEAYYVAAYRSILEEAVACRVRRLAKAPALLFSGGFDSGSIAAIAGPIVAAQGRRIVAVTSALAEGETRNVRDARAAVEAFRAYPYLTIDYHVRADDDGVFTDIETAFAATDDSAGTAYVRQGLFRLAARHGARLVMDGHGGDYTLNVRAPWMLGRILRRGDVARFAREYRARIRRTGRTWRAVLAWDVLPALLPLSTIAIIVAARRGFEPMWRTRPADPAFARRLIADGAIDARRLRQPIPVHNRWRARWLHLLSRIAQSPPVQSTLAGAAGLEFTRPFHDKRVVELALAIPESLQFRDGLERPLARHVFAGRLPDRLLSSGPGNDAEEPDLFRMAQAATPIALRKARALDRDGRLSRYIDFAKLDTLVADMREDRLADHRRLHVATRVTALALFIAWFERDNR